MEEEKPIIDQEKARKALKARMWSRWERWSKQEKGLRERQRRVLENLDDEFLFSFREKVDTALERQRERGNWLKRRRRMARGLLFEELVKNDELICPEKETETAKELREFMRQKHVELTKRAGMFRVPDFLIEEEGLIRGLIECKSGRLKPEQMGRFKRDLETAIFYLKNIRPENLARIGLAYLAENKRELRIGENFEQILVVPRGSKRTVGDFRVMEAAFFREEIDDLTGAILL